MDKAALNTIISTLQKDILDLRVSPLPQVKLSMLIDRSNEIIAAINNCHDSKASASQVHDNNHCDRVTATKFAKLFSIINNKACVALQEVENTLPFNFYYTALKETKRRCKHLLSIINNNKLDDKTTTEVETQVDEITSFIRNIKIRHSNITTHYASITDECSKSLGEILDLIEKSGQHRTLHNNIVSSLTEISKRHIKESMLFDVDYYQSRIHTTLKDEDAYIQHYVANSTELKYDPCHFFDTDFYKASQTEVSLLKFNPFEYFIRYGELLFSNPCEAFDTVYYLKRNDDVLDAGVSPFRHFSYHGYTEGRPPSANSGKFYSAQYIDKPKANVAVIASDISDEAMPWNHLRDAFKAIGSFPLEIISQSDADFDPAKFQAYIIPGREIPNISKEFLQRLYEDGSYIIYIGANPQEELKQLTSSFCISYDRFCAITYNYTQFIRWQENPSNLKLTFHPFDGADSLVPIFTAILDCISKNVAFGKRKIAEYSQETPIISVVSILYSKSLEMCAFLESLNRQDICHPYEVILVNDASPDDAIEIVQKWITDKTSSGQLNEHLNIKIITNELNKGNCLSRNIGILASKADIILVADGDVVFNNSTLTEHILAYSQRKCDAIIGFSRFNVDYNFVFDWVAACDFCSPIVSKKVMEYSWSTSQLRLPMNSPYNFVTRNVSFKKSVFNTDHFDENFSYTSAPNSGYGEEDHDFAVRLYYKGLNTVFLPSSIAVHIRHADSSNNVNKNLANLRNWNKLIKKFPELTFADRQYYQYRTNDLLNKTKSLPDSIEHTEAKETFLKSRSHVSIRLYKQYKILTIGNDILYKYRLLNMNHWYSDVILDNSCPLEKNSFFHQNYPNYASYYFSDDLFKAKDLILALLDHTFFYTTPEKHPTSVEATSFFSNIINHASTIPCIIVVQNSPEELFSSILGSASAPDVDGGIEAFKSNVKQLLRNTHIVCSSYQIASDWGFNTATIIWNGFIPFDYFPGTHTSGGIAPQGSNLQYSRSITAEELQYTNNLIKNNIIVEHSSMSDVTGKHTIEQASSIEFHHYVQDIGHHSFFVNPYEALPMPSLLPESMLVGNIPIVRRNMDTERFITDNGNGFFMDSFDDLDRIIASFHDKKIYESISKNARRTALDIFNIDRNISCWANLLKQVI